VQNTIAIYAIGVLLTATLFIFRDDRKEHFW